MNLDIAHPETLAIEGLAERARVAIDGNATTAAVPTVDLLTLRRLPGASFTFAGAAWRVSGAERVGPITRIEFRRIADG